MKAGLLLRMLLIALAMMGVVAFCLPRGTPHELGQRLLLAAERRHWLWARVLLDCGADPNVTVLAQSQLSQSGWVDGRPDRLNRPSALRQAIEQGNANAVRLLLEHHAKFTGEDIYKSQSSGSRAVINLMETLGNVPLAQRSVAQMPFTHGGEAARGEAIAGTVGAVPMHHLLWLSPHELLLLHDNPRRFASLDIQSGKETDLPALSEKWAKQDLFDPEMLALSPDSRWLLGMAGTSDRPIWLVTEVYGEGQQEWDRLDDADPAFHGTQQPMIAWRDSSRWVEIPMRTPHDAIVREYTLGQADARELPFDPAKHFFAMGNPLVLLTFAHPDQGWIHGLVGVHNYANHQPDDYVVLMAEVIPGTDSWHMENREIRLEKDLYPGWFERCVQSPDGRRLAWINLFSSSETRDILLSDADGKNFRIACEFIHPVQQWKEKRAEAPWLRSLEWTPQGDALIYWRGEKGENGLGLLHVAHGD